MGSHRSFTANTRMKVVAITKLGTDTPVRATARNTPADHRPGRTAESTPAGSPMSSDSTKATVARISDRGRRSM